MNGKDFELVKNYGQIREDVLRFQECIHRFVFLLSTFKAWYYIPEDDLLGPSKFIGYKRMTCEQYLR